MLYSHSVLPTKTCSTDVYKVAPIGYQTCQNLRPNYDESTVGDSACIKKMLLDWRTTVGYALTFQSGRSIVTYDDAYRAGSGSTANVVICKRKFCWAPHNYFAGIHDFCPYLGGGDVSPFMYATTADQE